MSTGGVSFDFSPLRKIRLELGVTQQQLAERAGIHYHTVLRLERNRTTPSLRQVFGIARALGVPHDRLFKVVG